MTEACAPANGYSKIDCSKAYVHRTGEDEPWAIRGLIHPCFQGGLALPSSTALQNS